MYKQLREKGGQKKFLENIIRSNFLNCAGKWQYVYIWNY